MSHNLNRQLTVQPGDLVNTASMIYHENSKVSEFKTRFGEIDPKQSEEMLRFYHDLNAHPRTFDHHPQVPIRRREWEDLGTPLGRLLGARRTNRKIANLPVSLDQIGDLLLYGLGTNGEVVYGRGSSRPLRTYPSGGALYPLDIYPILLNVDGADEGVYFLDLTKPSLSLLQSGSLRQAMFEAFIDDEMVRNAAAIIVFAGVFRRSRIKYGERAYRFVLLEAGHASENVVLTAQALGLSAVPTGAFYDRRLDSILDLDGTEESVVHALIVGHTA